MLVIRDFFSPVGSWAARALSGGDGTPTSDHRRAGQVVAVAVFAPVLTWLFFMAKHRAMRAYVRAAALRNRLAWLDVTEQASRQSLSGDAHARLRSHLRRGKLAIVTQAEVSKAGSPTRDKMRKRVVTAVSEGAQRVAEGAQRVSRCLSGAGRQRRQGRQGLDVGGDEEGAYLRVGEGGAEGRGGGVDEFDLLELPPHRVSTSGAVRFNHGTRGGVALDA